MAGLLRNSRSPVAALRRLEALRLEFGPDSGAAKSQLLRSLVRGRLGSRQTLLRLHEQLCFMRAYPDDRAVLERVTAMLRAFARRSDLRAHSAAFADSGIAGTRICYRFYWPTARRLASLWPRQLDIDWDALQDQGPLSAALALLVTPLEAAWLRGRNPDLKTAIEKMNGDKIGAAAFLVRRIEAMPGEDFTHEAFADALDTPMVITPGPDTPSRTLSWHAQSPVVFTHAPLRRNRPDLRIEIERPPRAVRAASPLEGAHLIKLALTALVTRSRDIDGIAYGNPRDVCIADDSHGLQWAFIGLVPERRQLLRASHGFVTLKNGVPIGYGQMDTLFGCADVSFNSFDTFRGAETAWIFSRLLAATKAVLGARAFTLDGYQVGHHNEEAIASGAWWFYYKLGFRPREAATRNLANAELARMQIKPLHRSSAATLRKLAADTMVLETQGMRAPRWEKLAEMGSLAAGRIAAMGNGNRETGLQECSRAAMRQLGLRNLKQAGGNPTDARRAWDAWAPLVSLIPLGRWSAGERRALADVILAKGGTSEREYLARFDAHPKLANSLRALTRV